MSMILSPAANRFQRASRGITILLLLALGAAGLSLSGCTCTDNYGTPVECPLSHEI